MNHEKFGDMMADLEPEDDIFRQSVRTLCAYGERKRKIKKAARWLEDYDQRPKKDKKRKGKRK